MCNKVDGANHPIIAVMFAKRMRTEQQLPARGHRRHVAIMPKCFMMPWATEEGWQNNTARRASDEDITDCKIFGVGTSTIARARKSQSLDLPAQKAHTLRRSGSGGGALQDLSNSPNRNRNALLLCDNGNGAKKRGPRTPKTEKSTAGQGTFHAKTTTTAAAAGVVLHNKLLRPQNAAAAAAAPARPRLGASSSIYIPQASMRQDRE